MKIGTLVYVVSAIQRINEKGAVLNGFRDFTL
jgi:hypothetical protein